MSAEPNLMSVHVDSNVTILGNLSHAPIDFMQDDQGLATAEEWRSLAESIQYSGLRSMLSENLMTSLCLDSVHCNSLVSGVKPTVNYNPKVLNMPTAEQIKTRLLKEMNLNFFDKFINWIENKAAIVCTITLFIQILIFILTIIDFLTDSNEANILRVLIRLLVRITLKLTSCCCKYNPLSKIVRRNRLGANQGANSEPISNIVRYNHNELCAIEMQPLKNQRVFAAL